MAELTKIIIDGMAFTGAFTEPFVVTATTTVPYMGGTLTVPSLDDTTFGDLMNLLDEHKSVAIVFGQSFCAVTGRKKDTIDDKEYIYTLFEDVGKLVYTLDVTTDTVTVKVVEDTDGGTF